jgi:hypothetical protein
MDDGTTAFLVIFWESIEPDDRAANMLIIYDAFDARWMSWSSVDGCRFELASLRS